MKNLMEQGKPLSLSAGKQGGNRRPLAHQKNRRLLDTEQLVTIAVEPIKSPGETE
jgi:hypothetical protein